jgi:hypothetical protein
VDWVSRNCTETNTCSKDHCWDVPCKYPGTDDCSIEYCHCVEEEKAGTCVKKVLLESYQKLECTDDDLYRVYVAI